MDHTQDPKKTELEYKLDKIFQVEPLISKDDIESVNNYMISGSWITENKVTKELEDKLSMYLDRKYAVAVPNGTIAIYLALLAAGVQKGMKVAVPNLTMIATINAVLWANAEPVLIDIRDMLSHHAEVDQSQIIMVNFLNFGASSLDFFVYCFTKTTDWATYHQVKESVLLEIAEIIQNNKAEIAFPTQTIDVKSFSGLE